ncbi:unnamed protein product, partial [Oppiella nova]
MRTHTNANAIWDPAPVEVALPFPLEVSPELEVQEPQ